MVSCYGKFMPNLSTLFWSSLQLTTEMDWVEVGKEAGNCIQKTAHSTNPDSLWPWEVTYYWMWCFSLWSPCSIGSWGNGWGRTPNSILFKVIIIIAPAERKYTQIDKEGLAIAFGVKHFHHYLFGRSQAITVPASSHSTPSLSPCARLGAHTVHMTTLFITSQGKIMLMQIC